ncbi:MAG: arginine--tRNA ligase [Candidatus Pacebacteria bacterium]|nr:arginine--tRNA ligase [Candidatus Paceibacterota bacterium]
MDTREYIKIVSDRAIRNMQKAGVLACAELPVFQVLKPAIKDRGDYAISVAMELAKLEKKNPMELAELLKEEISSEKDFRKYFSKIETAAPGFINFYLSPEYLYNIVKQVLSEKEKFGNLDLGKNKKVQVEFVSANPTGPLTVGNGRGGPFGDVLANVLKKAGYKTEKAYYVNDYGQQVLALGHSVLKDEEAKYSGEYIDELNKQLVPRIKDPYQLGREAAKIILETIIKKTIEKLNIKYDEWFSEALLQESGEVDKTIDLLKKKNFVYEKDGAQWFKATKFGDERDRVLIKSDGAKTYLAGDIAYHKYKFEKKKFDKAINVWGADHFGDVVGLKAGVEAFGYKNKLDIVLLQFVTVMKDGKPVKMSKRLGTAITMDDLLEELPADVVRFFFLQKSANTHLNFDMDLAKEQSDKNPVFYVQYAHARIASILERVEPHFVKTSRGKFQMDLLSKPVELSLIKQIARLPEIVEDTAKDNQVHRLTQYAIDLATSFHQFYGECHVLIDDEKLKQARLGLVLATKIVLKNTLDLLGVSAPEKM